ncbi:MAG: MBL fold metallo-hydrolase [Prolixibacteraceae bacterium]|nr:MBL fold metallo-hydrolase [Prolixibacteraceae bacterium]
MRRIFLFSIILALIPVFSFGKNNQPFEVFPLNHASMVIKYNGLTLYIDPANQYEKLTPFSVPDLILITHTHGDHYNKALIDSLKNDQTVVVGNKKAIDDLGYGKALKNGEKTEIKGIKIEAIASYNLPPENTRFHPKGEGNGYVLTLSDERVYISGDTEDTPEMRNLKNIDHAFICMNMPYTMTPEKAASAVLEFKPKKVYPYHYRQRDGFGDIEKFKELVSVDPAIEVIFLDWYD